IFPFPRLKVAPLLKTSPPSNQLINTVSSGAGISKCSPYISSFSNSKYESNPSVIGCVGSTTHTLSFSSASRHLRSQDVPIKFLNIFEKCPECNTTRPMPSHTRCCTFSTMLSSTSSCALCPHQTSTSVFDSTSSVRPCCGSSKVAVLT